MEAMHKRETQRQPMAFKYRRILTLEFVCFANFIIVPSGVWVIFILFYQFTDYNKTLSNILAFLHHL